jgi:hypothetical protein
LKAEKVTMVLEAIGDDRVRVRELGRCEGHSRRSEPRSDREGQNPVAARVQRALEFLNVELTGSAEAGYGPETK